MGTHRGLRSSRYILAFFIVKISFGQVSLDQQKMHCSRFPAVHHIATWEQNRITLNLARNALRRFLSPYTGCMTWSPSGMGWLTIWPRPWLRAVDYSRRFFFWRFSHFWYNLTFHRWSSSWLETGTKKSMVDSPKFVEISSPYWQCSDAFTEDKPTQALNCGKPWFLRAWLD